MDKTPDRLTISSEALGQLQCRKAIFNIEPFEMHFGNAFVERSRFHFNPDDLRYHLPQDAMICLTLMTAFHRLR